MNDPTIVFFAEQNGIITGQDKAARQWRIFRVLTGWRLEFMDPGDTAPTRAGIYRTVQDAASEAGRLR